MTRRRSAGANSVDVVRSALTPDSALAIARSLVRQVRDCHEEIARDFPEPFQLAGVQEEQAGLLQACSDAQSRLDRPSLTVAMMGTTSSGKSTLVNGLVGRRLAPIEAGEMSAGVLHVISDSQSTIKLGRLGSSTADTAGSPFESDTEAYGLLQTVMHDFHAARRSAAVTPPEAWIRSPAVSVLDPSCLRMPTGLRLEMLDLPGVLSVSDNVNLGVIRVIVGRAFSLVTLDYNQTDDEHRGRLLDELSHVVGAMGGTPELMVFVLNRVDTRSADDIPLDDRIEVLATEIREKLHLAQQPRVLPMSARLLYWAQCSWGTAPIEGEPSSALELRLQCLRNLLTECASDLARIGDSSDEFFALLRRVGDGLRTGEMPSTVDHRALLLEARASSGAAELWGVLNTRLSESFAEVVIFPAVVDVLDAHDRLIGSLRSWAEAHEQSSLLDITEHCRRLESEHRRLKSSLNAKSLQLQSDIETAKTLLATGDYEDQVAAQKLLGPGMINFTDAVNEVRRDVVASVVSKLADAFGRRTRLSTLKSTLESEGFVEPHVASRLADSLDTWWLARAQLKPYRRANVEGSTKGSTADEWRVPIKDKEAQAQLKVAERSLREIYADGQVALTHCAEYLLNTKAQTLEHGVESMIGELRDRISTDVITLDLMASVREQLVDEVGRSMRVDEVGLKQGLFEATPQIQTSKDKRKEQTGTRKEKRTRGWWIFKWSKTVTVPVFENVTYRILTVPTAKAFKAEWVDATEASRNDLQDSLLEWSGDLLADATDAFQEHVDRIVDMATQALGARRRELESEEFEVKRDRADFDSRLAKSADLSKNLATLRTSQELGAGNAQST